MTAMPKTANLLAVYLKRSKESHRAFAVRAGIGHLHPMVSQWAGDKRTPGLVPALAIERATRGKVPASYWPERREYIDSIAAQ